MAATARPCTKRQTTLHETHEENTHMNARYCLLRIAFNGRRHRPVGIYPGWLTSVYRDCALLRDRLRVVR